MRDTFYSKLHTCLDLKIFSDLYSSCQWNNIISHFLTVVEHISFFLSVLPRELSFTSALKHICICKRKTLIPLQTLNFGQSLSVYKVCRRMQAKLQNHEILSSSTGTHFHSLSLPVLNCMLIDQYVFLEHYCRGNLFDGMSNLTSS